MEKYYKKLEKPSAHSSYDKIKLQKSTERSYYKDLELQETLKAEFIKYLINRGYKEYTPSGLGSTSYDYAGRIDYVVYTEHFRTWVDVFLYIEKLLVDYGEDGVKSDLGKKSNSAVINALRRFYEFLVDNMLR